MDKAFRKWGALCAIGVGFLVFTAMCFIREEYTWIFAGALAGIFLITTSYKRIRFLKNAGRALEAGKKEIIIHYRDKNLKESRNAVIPAGADTLWFYGYLLEKKDIKAFRWQGIRQATENGKDMQKNDILEYLEDSSAKK